MGEVEVHALRGVSLDLFESEFLVLLGPSGSGKSTLLNILGGLDVPTSGTVIYRGQNLTSADERALTMYRPQACRLRVPVLQPHPEPDRARERRARHRHRRSIRWRRMRRCSSSKLGDRLDHFPSQLSGGEQQRVAIARAVAKRPDVLLCDEPTGALDIATGILVLEAIQRVNRELGTTTAVITHNAAVAGMADRVVSLSDGRIRERTAERQEVWRPSELHLVMRPLDRKLLRDLWSLKGQALAISLVIGAGVAMFIMYLSTFASLRLTQQTYYDRYRFAHVFAALTFARRSRCRRRIAEIPGVARVAGARRRGRHARCARPDGTGQRPPDRHPDSARADAERSLPAAGPLPGARPIRRSARQRGVRALALDSAPATASAPSSTAGGANCSSSASRLSPEYVYSIRPGELIPDDCAVRHLLDARARTGGGVRHGGRLQQPVADAAAGRVVRPTSSPVLDRLLALVWRASARSRALCRRRTGTSTTSCGSCRASGLILPIVFLLVAAFLLNVVLTRIVGGAARADRGVEGARLHQRRAGVALREAQSGHRRGGRRCSAWSSAPGWDPA